MKKVLGALKHLIQGKKKKPVIRMRLKYYKAMNDVFIKLNNLRRWTDFTTQQKYNELSKQAFNCIIVYLLGKISEHYGKEVKFESFPHIAMGRACAKVYVYFDTPEHKITEICNISGIPRDSFNKVAKLINEEHTNKEFAEFIDEQTDSYEVRLYKAATKIATFIEIKEHDNPQQEKVEQIFEDLRNYFDVPGVEEFANENSEIFKLLCEISSLRNQVRWATCSYTTECSVLGHLFDTAVFAYLNAIDEGLSEEVATKLFFMGIYHDIPEAWTKDIPSPIKDRIKDFREATEIYELQMIETHMYQRLPQYLADAVKEVTMEDKDNEDFKDRLKDADYQSADSECDRNYVSGSADKYFANVIRKRKVKSKSKCARRLHRYFKRRIRKVKKI